MDIRTKLQGRLLSSAVGAILALSLPLAVLAAEGAQPADDGDKPAAPEVKPEQVSGGLQLTLVMKERSFRMGRGEDAVERKVKVPTIVIKNVGDKPLVLDFPLPTGGAFGGRGGFGEPMGIALGPVTVSVKRAEADDEEVPGAEAEERPITLVVVKPGQVLEQSLAGSLRFPGDGRYKLQIAIDAPAGEEVLPGIRPWSGKVKSNELDYEYQDMGGRGNFGGRGNRGGGQAPAPIPGEPNEAF